MVQKPMLNSPDEVEALYYESFRRCDAELMATLWSSEDAVCVHPGSNAIVGHRAIMRSWGYIFDGASRPEIDVSVIRRIESEELVVHIVTERIGKGDEAVMVLATNVYRQGTSGWLMVEHHASLLEDRRSSHTLQ